MIFSFYDTAAMFFIYGFLGWCVEVAFVSVTTGKVVNRGFLNGPICPIYGVGMVGVLMALIPLQDNLFILFAGALLICSAIELFGGWILDKLFHMRWWDYSDQPFNLKGYVCLSFSIMWGIGAIIMVKLVHPSIYKTICKIPEIIVILFLVAFAIIFIVDMIVTLKTVIGIKKSLGQIERIAEGMNSIGNQLKDVVGNSAITVSEKAGEGKEKVVVIASESKERIVGAYENKKEKLADAYEYNKEKLVEAFEANKEKWVDAYEINKEKLADVFEVNKEKLVELKKQRNEMEGKYSALLDKLQKQSKRHIKAFPTFKISGSTESLKDKINSLIRK